MAARRSAGEDASALWPVRVTALVVLAGLALFVPLELRTREGPQLPPQLLCYAVVAAVTLGVYVASRCPGARRHVDGLALTLSLAVAATTIAYVAIVPAAGPIMSGVLVSLLVGSTVVAGWSVERAVAAGLLVCVGFAAVAGIHVGAGIGLGTLGFCLATLMIGAGVAIACATGLERVREGLARRQRELTDLSARLMSIHEEERQRLSRELHDELGQSLTAVLSYLWLIERQVPQSTPELRGRVAEARRLASTTLTQIRELSQRLRPSVLDDYGLVPSLEAHVRSFGERQSIVTSFHAQALPPRLSAEIETAVFRITQEALGNVARHARARHVSVDLGVDGRELTLAVHDDGIGLDAARANGSAGAGMGLIGIRERVRALGGRLSLTSRSGAHLEVRLPLPPETAPPTA